jgi:phage-related protein
MKTFSTPITNEVAAEQSAWVELYDIYLKSAITTPWGSTNVIRLCNRIGKQFSFFTPEVAPENTGTQGDAAIYYPWPLKRAVVKSSGQFADNKLEITGSNVTAEFAEMIATIDWYDTPVMIRKTSPNIVGATAADCAILFSGLVDSIRMDDKAITLVCSNDLALLNRILPSENMHANCRFKWADDQCTAVRFKAENYKSKTVGSSSTTTLVKSAGLTEDTGNSASYGTDLIDALADPAFSASSERTVSAQCVIETTTLGYFRIMSYVQPVRFEHNQPIQITLRFAVGYPTGFAAATTYYVRDINGDKFKLSATSGGAAIDSTITAGDWYFTGINAYEALRVRSSDMEFGWYIGDTADWGTVDNAYYVIPDAQAGLKNADLKPYIQFDLGSAKTPKLWRVQTYSGRTPEESVRLIQFFSSPDASTWTFESYFEMPNRGGEYFDVLIPKAASARYWRICIRSKWGETLSRQMFYRVQAYELSRNWWQDGTITFGAATTTVALRNVTRKVLESYDGQVVVQELPAAPVSGDTFVIERGCARTFNACCARLNTENYGGFNDLPTQTVIR